MSLLVVMVLSCVIPYGDPAVSVRNKPKPPPVVFTGIEARLNALLDETDDVDQIARLEAAVSLARGMTSQDPAAQQIVLDYLNNLADLERRAAPIEPQQLETPVQLEEPVVEEEVLETDVEAVLQRARGQLSVDEPGRAMETLQQCEGQPCWTEVEELWAHAREVYLRKTSAAALTRLRESLDEPDPGLRREQLVVLRAELRAIRERHSGAQALAEVEVVLERVGAEIDAVDRQ